MKLMNNVLLAGIAGVFVASGIVGTAIYLRRKRIEREISERTEQIEDELQFDDVVSYLRSLNLSKDVDVPFIANSDSEGFKKVTYGLLKPKKGYKLLMIGVFNKTTEEITYSKFIYSPSWAERLTNMLGNDSFILLG